MAEHPHAGDSVATGARMSKPQGIERSRAALPENWRHLQLHAAVIRRRMGYLSERMSKSVRQWNSPTHARRKNSRRGNDGVGASVSRAW